MALNDITPDLDVDRARPRPDIDPTTTPDVHSTANDTLSSLRLIEAIVTM
ncbi:MAG TPA: hypothetical protein VNU28_02015 [Solirubrobacteraceae bacterium]|nr:hypothetical protein [Solirubrobacteraceae bacterium]